MPHALAACVVTGCTPQVLPPASISPPCQPCRASPLQVHAVYQGAHLWVLATVGSEEHAQDVGALRLLLLAVLLVQRLTAL